VLVCDSWGVGDAPDADGYGDTGSDTLAHVARAVVFMASLPLDTNVLTMTIMATKMPFVGRG